MYTVYVYMCIETASRAVLWVPLGQTNNWTNASIVWGSIRHEGQRLRCKKKSEGCVVSFTKEKIACK